jgi:hypothetical protein
MLSWRCGALVDVHAVQKGFGNHVLEGTYGIFMVTLMQSGLGSLLQSCADQSVPSNQLLRKDALSCWPDSNQRVAVRD